MKNTIFLMYLSIFTSCDADRTELPPLRHQETQKLDGLILTKSCIEVTLTHPNPKNTDSTYVRIKNVSGRQIIGLEFFLESCPKEDSELSKCQPDYHFIMSPDRLLADQQEIVDKTRQHINFKYRNRIYITSLTNNNSGSKSILSGRYNYSNVTQMIENSAGRKESEGIAKLYITVDATIFLRGQILDLKTNEPSYLRFIGNLFQNGDVYLSDLSLSENLPSYIYFGKATNNTVSVSAKNTTGENITLKMILK